MTDKTSPDLLDLAEAVVRGDLQAADAEWQVRAGGGSGPDSDEAVRELLGLIAAARAVRSHAQATRDAAASASVAGAHQAGAIGTVVAGPVRAGAAHRHPSNGGDGQPRRRTWLLAVATVLVGTGVIGASLVGGGLTAPTPAPTDLLAVSSPTIGPARTASWTTTGSTSRGGGGDTATQLRDGRVLLIHVYRGDNERYPAELYDPTAGSWTATGSTFGGSWGVTLLDGTVLALAGDPAGRTELYDPGTGSWTTTGSLVGAHQGGETVTLLLDGRVLLAGGFDDRNPPKGATASAELYDPTSGSWTVTGSMVTPRGDHTATLLPDGKVLVAGGGDWENQTATAELYDPATGMWTATGTMQIPYSGQVATGLADGKVLVMGFVQAPSFATPALGPNCSGGPCEFVSVVELYDPASGTWSATGTMAVARQRFTATLLRDGTVLVAGGIGLVSGSYSDVDMASAELYDPGTGSWITTATMSVARAAHTATLLPYGSVLVTGGTSAGTSAELYDSGSGN